MLMCMLNSMVGMVKKDLTQSDAEAKNRRRWQSKQGRVSEGNALQEEGTANIEALRKGVSNISQDCGCYRAF